MRSGSCCEGYPASAIAEKTAVRDFIVKRNISLGRHFEITALREAVAYGTELEEEIKTGRITDRLAVELMIQKVQQGIMIKWLCMVCSHLPFGRE